MKFIRSFSIYTLSGFIKAGIPFLILPILTNYLEPEDYGIVSLFNALERFLMAFITLGIVDTLSFEYFKLDKKAFQSKFSSSLLVSFSSFTLVLVLSIFLQQEISLLTGIPEKWVVFVPISCICFIFATLVPVILRNQNRPVLFGAYSIGMTVVEVSLTLLFVVALAMSWEGRLQSHLVTAGIFLILALIFFKRQDLITFKVSKAKVFAVLAVGLPLVPDAISVFVLELSDRFFLSKMMGLTSTGIYSVGSQISMIIIIFTTAFANAFFPVMYKTLKDGDESQRRKIVKYTYYFLTFLLLSVFGLSFVGAPLIFRYLIHESYAEGLNYVFFIGLGYFFLAINVMFKGYILYNKKMRYMAITSITAMILNLVLNYFFINAFGTIGAAYATTTSYFVSAVMIIYFSVKTEPMPWLYFLRRSS